MSSRFVSGGTITAGAEGGANTAAEGASSSSTEPAKKNTEWEAVQQELEAERKQREERRVKAAQGEERSLYDILQANKAAKQAAFEEQNKISNQFRALDDDEVEFLDEVKAAKRREEEAVRRETEEGLKAFRERRQTGGSGAVAADDDAAGAGNTAENQAEGEEEWAVAGRKRKRVKDKARDVKGVRRKVSDGAERIAEGETDEVGGTGATKAEGKTGEEEEEEEGQKKKSGPAAGGGLTDAASKPPTAPAKKGLVDYGSDDSDDE